MRQRIFLDVERACTQDVTQLTGPYSKENITHYQDKLVYYETSRGCPFNCSFCLSSATKGVRYFALDQIYRDFELFVSHTVSTIKIVDRTFSIPEDRAMTIIGYIKKFKELYPESKTIFHLEIVADRASAAMIELLCSLPSGVIQLEIGIQSTNPKTLEEIHRKTDISLLRQNIEALVESGTIHVHLDLIAGLPFETYKDFKNSFNTVISLHPHHFQLGFLKKLSGTPLSYDQTHGNIFESEPPYEICQNKYIAFFELMKLKKIEEVVEKVYNSQKFTHLLTHLTDECRGDSFELFGKMADHVFAVSEAGISFNTLSLFDWMYRFIVEEFPKNPFLIQALTFDYFLLEKPRHFPHWLPTHNGNKIVIQISKELLAEAKKLFFDHVLGKFIVVDLAINVSGGERGYLLSETRGWNRFVIFYPKKRMWNQLPLVRQIRHIV